MAILAIDDEERVLSSASTVRRPAGSCSRSRREPSTSTRTAARSRTRTSPLRRELEEETGYRAGSLRLLTSFWTAPGFATELMHLYLATNLRPADADRIGPDEDERLELERIPVSEALDAIERGEIADAKSILALLWLGRLRRGAGG